MSEMNTTADRLRGRKETAEILGISVQTLDRLQLPRIKVSARRIGFKDSVIAQYVASRETV